MSATGTDVPLAVGSKVVYTSTRQGKTINMEVASHDPINSRYDLEGIDSDIGVKKKGAAAAQVSAMVERDAAAPGTVKETSESAIGGEGIITQSASSPMIQWTQ